ncbi:MAG: tol-pal system YbgF family protein [Saprospiraceae bacterium]
MSLKETDHNLIDKYLRSQLDTKEKELFETKQKDLDFQKELNLRKDSLPVFKKNGREALKKKLQNFEKNIQEEKQTASTSTAKVKPINKIVWLGMAATLLLLMGLFWWSTQSVNSDELFAQNFQPYPNIIAPIVKSQTPSATEYELAFQKYEQGKYQDAIPLLEKIETEEGKFYLAISHLGNEQEGRAISILDELAKESSNRFFEASQWYLALAYLKSNQPGKADEVLDLIVKKPSHNFYKQAKSLSKN